MTDQNKAYQIVNSLRGVSLEETSNLIVDQNIRIAALESQLAQFEQAVQEDERADKDRIATLEAQNARLVEALEKRQDIKRFTDAYDFLVDETETPNTIYSKIRHDRLSDLLELFEYLRGEDEANPLDKWFPKLTK